MVNQKYVCTFRELFIILFVQVIFLRSIIDVILKFNEKKTDFLRTRAYTMNIGQDSLDRLNITW